MYAVNNINTGEDTLLIISAASEQIVKSIPIGEGITDMTIHYGEDRLYVTNWQRPTTPVVDLTTQTLLPSLSLGTDVYKINAGRPGRIYYENQDQWINIYFVNTATGERLNSFAVREGDGEIDPTGQYYYHCENNISNAAIIKYNISSDNPNPPSFGRSREHPYGSRNLILSGDGSRLFWQGYVYDANLDELRSLGEEIYATTLHGDLVFGQSRVYNTHTGQVIDTLPLSTTVMAVSGDQTKLFAYDGTSRQLVVIPMSEIAPTPGTGTNPLPVDRSTIVLPLEKLSWSLNPSALRYQVYFGSDSAAVANADSTSLEYLGSVTPSEMALSQTLNLEGLYCSPLMTG